MNNYTVSSKELTQGFCRILAEATVAYDRGEPIMSDEEWDNMYFEVKKWMEEHPGELEDTCLDKIYFKEVSKLNKVEHNHPMLSLDKTKDLEDIKAFCGDKECIAMLKMDGLTCSLLYKDGRLVRAETRGNGYIGEDITHNARVIKSIPKYIDYKGALVVDGEVICKYDDFESFAAQYKNPRNFAAGSIRLLNSEESYSRNLTFVAWDCLGAAKRTYAKNKNGVRLMLWEEDFKTLSEELEFLAEQGFEAVPYVFIKLQEQNIENKPFSSAVNQITNTFSLDVVETALKEVAKQKQYPIDGLVFKYNDIKYYDSLGSTAHHFRGGLAYKFYDETYETTLRDIEWTMGRTGVLTPVAIFDEVDTGDSKITRANLHNISIMEELGLDRWYDGLKIEIFQANMIIPQVKSICLGQPEGPKYPFELEKCPICGAATEIRQINDSKELVCTNPECQGKLINRLDHFCSKKGLDIKGLSKATLEKLIDWGWVSQLSDIYNLPLYAPKWKTKVGFGPKSVDNILAAIEASRDCELDKFIAAIGIPLIGNNVAKEIVKYVKTYDEFRDMVTDHYPFYNWDGFAEAKSDSLWNFNYSEADDVYHYLRIKEPQIPEDNNTLEGKTFVITGRLTSYANRDALKKVIEEHGGKVVGSISGNTSYLINNDIESTSAKNKAAKDKGIPIISEEQFNAMI